MKRIALLVIVLAAGCSNKKPEERKLSESPSAPAPAPAPPGSTAPAPAPAPGSAAPGSAAGSGSAPAEAPAPAAGAATGTGFAPFDDAVAGTKPWVSADDKAGIVALSAVDDPSGKTKGQFSVDRRCGPDAAKAVEAQGTKMATRAKSGHDPVKCTEAAGTTTCFQPGVAESDVGLVIQYKKRGDAWAPVGTKTHAMGVKMDTENAKYAQLLETTCK